MPAAEEVPKELKVLSKEPLALMVCATSRQSEQEYIVEEVKGKEMQSSYASSADKSHDDVSASKEAGLS